MNRTFYTGSYPELQTRFIAEVSAQRRNDPLAPLDVVVNGPLVRMALRRELAREGGSHANIRFFTLNELIRHAAEPALRAQGARLLNDVARGPLMMRAVEDAGRLDYFGQISGRDGFLRALWRTLGELRGAGVRSDDLPAAAERLNESPLQTKLRDLCGIWIALTRLMRTHGYADSHDLLEWAIEQAAFDEAAPIILYGFHDLTALERRFVEILVHHRDAAVYLPFGYSPAFEWVKPLYDFFCKAGFRPEAAAPHPADDSSRLTALKRHLFGDIPPRDYSCSPDDHSVQVLSAATREREAEELVRGLLYSPLAEAVPRRRIGILLREGEPYLRLFRDELERAGIHGYFHQCRTLGQTPTGRTLLRLTTLLDERFRRTDVMEFLLASPVKQPAALASSRPDIPAAEWNHFSLAAGISGGAAAWDEGLTRLRRHWEAELQRGGEDDEDGGISPRRITSLQTMQVCLRELFARLRAVNDEATWEGRASALWMLLNDWTECGGEDLAAIERALEPAAALDHMSISLTREHFAAMIRSALSAPAEREGRFQVHEPAIVTFSEAAGVMFDEVLVPGLVEKEIPRPAAQDPLLLDDDRRILARLIKRDLPTRDRERLRERFLFHSAVSGAARRLVLSLPRRDAAEGRERLPSTFLLNSVEVIRGERTDYAGLERWLRAGPPAVRVPSPRLQNTGLPAATTMQYDIARLAEALHRRSAESIADLRADRSFFARGIEAERQRFRTEDFTRFDGRMESHDLRARLRAYWNPQDRPLAPTRLEQYATCPFQFFAQRVLDLDSVPEPEAIPLLPAWERGNLIHDILERFYRQERDAGRLPLRPGSEDLITPIADAVFRNFAARSITPPLLLWSIEREQILERLKRFLRGEAEAVTRHVPAYFEVRYGIPGGEPPSNADPLQVTLKSGETLRFHGRIDRIDIAPEGTARVVDYKTGRQQSHHRNSELSGGRALQLPFYRLAAEKLLDLPVETAEYRFLSSDGSEKIVGFSSDDWETNRDRFFGIIETIHTGISEGRYFPYPEPDQCRVCPVQAACGAGRMTAKWHLLPESGRNYSAMREDYDD